MSSNLKLHEAQMAVYDSSSRFKCVVAGRRFGKCLASGTLISMADGSERQIQELSPNDLVLTINEDTYKPEAKKITHVLNNGVKETLTVKTHVRSLRCTPNHPILANSCTPNHPNHSIVANDRWIEAGDLKAGDLVAVLIVSSVVGEYLTWEEVIAVDSEERCQTWDLSVDGNHNFISNGIVTHNTILSKTLMIKYAVKPRSKVWYVAPTYRMAKQIMWQDLQDSIPDRWIRKCNDTTLTIWLVNGSMIELKGADNADSLRGVGLDFLVLDEFQDMTEDTWVKVLRPTLADRQGHALFIGCVNERTRVLKRDGVVEIGKLSNNSDDKTLDKIDLDLYGLDREFHNADGFWNNGVVETRKITTHLGFELESSLPHPIWVMGENGNQVWKKTKDLVIGDRVSIARGMEVWGDKEPLDGWAAHVDNWRKGFVGKLGPKPRGLIHG